MKNNTESRRAAEIPGPRQMPRRASGPASERHRGYLHFSVMQASIQRPSVLSILADRPSARRYEFNLLFTKTSKATRTVLVHARRFSKDQCGCSNIQESDYVCSGGSSARLYWSICGCISLEAIDCTEGLSLAADLGFQKMRLAPDSSNVIRSLGENHMGAYGHVVKEIKARANDFQDVQFVYKSRKSNVDAHILARGSVSLETGRHVWLLAPPDVTIYDQLRQQLMLVYLKKRTIIDSLRCP
uniref:RNase H type-1 domain-containing protein n=1 Tax=Leersia perrieri TaxID=77586 RepID=A0A0D9V854_9ORYZ